MAQAVLQQPRETAQHFVACQVAMGIVELLEVVEVEHQSDQRLGLALGFADRLPGEQVETAAVGQAGQAVEGSQGFQA
ncbi:hypothetical protein D3C86_1863140 [compost metagenome]